MYSHQEAADQNKQRCSGSTIRREDMMNYRSYTTVTCDMANTCNQWLCFMITSLWGNSLLQTVAYDSLTLSVGVSRMPSRSNREDTAALASGPPPLVSMMSSTMQRSMLWCSVNAYASSRIFWLTSFLSVLMFLPLLLAESARACLHPFPTVSKWFGPFWVVQRQKGHRVQIRRPSSFAIFNWRMESLERKWHNIYDSVGHLIQNAVSATIAAQRAHVQSNKHS